MNPPWTLDLRHQPCSIKGRHTRRSWLLSRRDAERPRSSRGGSHRPKHGQQSLAREIRDRFRIVGVGNTVRCEQERDREPDDGLGRAFDVDGVDAASVRSIRVCIPTSWRSSSTMPRTRVLVVDETLVGLLTCLDGAVSLEHIVVVARGSETAGISDYESLLAGAQPIERPELDERQAAAMCYTSGTTGRPKGVVYSHRALVLHSMAVALPDALGVSADDTVLPVVPMFHVNAWGLPFTCAMTGAGLVLPGPKLDPVSVLDLLETQHVTMTTGRPHRVDGHSGRARRRARALGLTALKRMVVGGSAVPAAMIDGFDRHALTILARSHGGRKPASETPAVGDWRSAFLRMPYIRDGLARMGAVPETFETATTWDRLPALMEAVRTELGTAARRITGHRAAINCRLTPIPRRLSAGRRRQLPQLIRESSAIGVDGAASGRRSGGATSCCGGHLPGAGYSGIPASR
jgi:AMP-binding enzyme